jgi:hypothetical protein
MRSPWRGVGGVRKRRENSMDRCRGGSWEEREFVKGAAAILPGQFAAAHGPMPAAKHSANFCLKRLFEI